MRPRIARFHGGSLLALVLVAQWACASGSTPPPGSAAFERENTVRAALGQDPASISLVGKEDRNTEVLSVQITDSLVQYDAQLRLQPRVAESWQWSEDHRTITFRLREGVRWQDGAPVTAEDAAFTIESVRKPAVESRTYGPGFRDVLAVDVPDSRTLRVTFRTANPGTLDAFVVPLIPRHVAGRDADLLTGEFSRRPIGCGPFRFVRYRPGQDIVLEANDDYWDGRPFIDRLVFKIHPEASTAYQALLRGELDVLTVTSAQWAESKQSADGARLARLVVPTLNVWAILWNQKGNPFFADPRVRQAMVHALDRETFAATVANGHARPEATLFLPEMTWTDPEIRPRAYDPRRARELLGEAGWVDSDGDGVRDRDGAPFRFTLLYPVGRSALSGQIAAWEQQSWAALGIGAEIRQLEWQAFRELRNAGRFEAVAFNLGFTPDPDQFFDVFHSSARDGFNVYGFSDPEVDASLEAGRSTFDEAARRQIYRRLQRRLYELEPITCTFSFSLPVLLDRRLHGVAPSPRDYWRTTEGPRVWRWKDD